MIDKSDFLVPKKDNPVEETKVEQPKKEEEIAKTDAPKV